MYEQGTIITLKAGAYRLRAPLAGSAYGVLWRADGPAAVGAVAVKLVNRAQMQCAQVAQRAHWTDCAHAEIAFLSSLSPWDARHIVRLLDSGTHDRLPAMALELLDGDLARHVAAERAARRELPFARVMAWIEQASHALATVHQYGWRYLDLKPSNLLLDAHGRLKLADFGTTRLLADLAPHVYAGTASWQAPEQFFPAPDGRYRTGLRTDYFALGALFYYLVNGGEPLRMNRECGEAYRVRGSDAAASLLQRHGGRQPATLQPSEAARFARRIDGEAPGAGQCALALLRSLLAAQPGRRPGHALEISRALGQVRSAMDRTQGARKAA
jgi:serine/threonine-protein kinase